MSTLTVMDFYSPTCAPCRLLNPIIDKMREEFPEVNFEKVDVTKDPEKPRQYAVTALPTLVIKNGRVLWQHSGFQPSLIIELRRRIQLEKNK